MKNGLKIIDMRCRPPYKSFLNEGYPFTLFEKRNLINFQKMCGSPSITKVADTHSMADFIEEMDKAGIDLAVAPYRAAWSDPINQRAPLDNGELVALMTEYPHRFIGVAGISPVYDTYARAKQIIQDFCFDGPLRGIAIEPIIDQPNWLLNDERALAIYDLLRGKNIPVLITFSSMPLEQVQPLGDILRLFPDVNFVICHGGTPRNIELIDLAFTVNNLYLSPDGNMINTHTSRLFIDAGNYMLRDRLLFGSAYPGTVMDFAIEYYMRCGFREEVLPGILYDNAARLFGLE